MSWLYQLHATQPVAQAIGVLALVCVAGMLLGSIKVRGIELGTAGVLFAGIITGYFTKPVDHATLAFVKEFGLILFVFTIGLQLGPGFFAALRRDGLRLNAVVVGVVLFSSSLAVLFGWLLGMDAGAVLGMLSGATTSTPSLGAAQQALATQPGASDQQQAVAALAYAVTYPAAIAAIMGTLVLLKRIFRIDTGKEVAALTADREVHVEALEHRTLIVENPNLANVTVDAIPSRAETRVVVLRHRRAGSAEVGAVAGDTQLQPGDSILVVGTAAMLDRFELVVGRRTHEELRFAAGRVAQRAIVVTCRNVLGTTVENLALDDRCGVAISSVTRADIAIAPSPDLRLNFGDVVLAIGDEPGLKRAEQLLGNSVKDLNETHFVPLFIGIALGVIVGTMPIAVPGLPGPVQLGLAGGPLVIALLLGRLGHIGPFVFYVPLNANLAFREFGIALFFAAVGLGAGPMFFTSVFSATGASWLFAGLCITVLPLLLFGLLARIVLKMNFAVLGGMLAGSVTDPPALEFITTLTKSDAPTLAYVTVYPLTTLMRILAAQILALMLIH